MPIRVHPHFADEQSVYLALLLGRGQRENLLDVGQHVRCGLTVKLLPWLPARILLDDGLRDLPLLVSELPQPVAGLSLELVIAILERPEPLLATPADVGQALLQLCQLVGVSSTAAC